MSTASLNWAPPKDDDQVGVVCISNFTVTAFGSDDQGRQVNRDFDPRVIDGPRSAVTVVPRTVAKSWVTHKGAVLRMIPAKLTHELHTRAKACWLEHGPRALCHVWMDVFNEPWPGDAEARNSAEERLRLIKVLRDGFYPIDSNWTIGQLQRYAEKPDLILADKAEAVVTGKELPTKPAPKGKGKPAAEPVDDVDAFLAASQEA